jgi:hypothetical protein
VLRQNAQIMKRSNNYSIIWFTDELLADSFLFARENGKHTAILGGNMLAEKLLRNVKMQHAGQSRQVTGLEVFNILMTVSVTPQSAATLTASSIGDSTNSRLLTAT